MKMLLLIYSLLLLSSSHKGDSSSIIDIKIHNYSISRGPDVFFDVKESLIKIPGGYGGKADILLKEDWGNDNKFLCEAQLLKRGKFQLLIALEGIGACDTVNKYLGSLWRMVETLYGVKNPGECPVAKGRYNYDDYINITVDSAGYLLKLVPNVRGVVRVTCTMWDLDGNEKASGWGIGESVWG